MSRVHIILYFSMLLFYAMKKGEGGGDGNYDSEEGKGREGRKGDLMLRSQRGESRDSQAPSGTLCF